MSLDTITKEQFQMYKEVHEKEKELQDYQTKSKEDYSTAITAGLVTVICAAGATVLGTASSELLDLSASVIFGLAALGLGYGTYRTIKYNIPKTNKAIGSLEKELEELKSKPEYQALKK